MKKNERNSRRALEGEISESELRELIANEAKLLGLTFSQALKRAKKRTLPRSYLGDDLALLIDLLPA